MSFLAIQNIKPIHKTLDTGDMATMPISVPQKAIVTNEARPKKRVSKDRFSTYEKAGYISTYYHPNAKTKEHARLSKYIDPAKVTDQEVQLFIIANVFKEAHKHYFDNKDISIWFNAKLSKLHKTALAYSYKIMTYIGNDQIEIYTSKEKSAANKLNNKIFLAENRIKEFHLVGYEKQLFQDLMTCTLAIQDMVDNVKLEKQVKTYCKYLLTNMNNFYKELKK